MNPVVDHGMTAVGDVTELPGRSRPVPHAARTALTPVWVSRTNLFPHLDLAGPDRAASDEETLEELLRMERLRELLADDVVEELAELIADDRDRASREWLPLRRATMSGRRPKDRQVADPTLRVRPALSVWLDTWGRTDDLSAALDSTYDDAVARERRVITAWAQDEDVQRSTVMTSRSLHRAVDSRAGLGEGVPSKRQRKSEASLVTYFGRSTSKVSPFARYTGTAVHQLDDVAGALGDAHRSVVATRRLLLRRGARRLGEDPIARRHLSWRVSDAVRRQGDELLVHRREYVTAGNARSDVVSENDLRLPLTGSWGHVWDVLSGAAAEAAGWDEIRQALADGFGWAAERAEDLLAAMVQVQVLTPSFPVREQEDDFLERWAELLAPLPGQTAALLREAVQASLDGERQLAGSSAASRAALVEQAESAWTRALGERVEHPFVEDCYLRSGAPVDGDQIRHWSGQVSELAGLLVVMDDQRLLAAALESTFVRHFGVGGTCHDLRRFARQAYDTFPLTQELLAGRVPDDIRHLVAPLLQARQIVSEHLVELGRSGGETAELDLAEIDRAAALVPDREWDLPRSTTVFGQPAGDQLVLNHLYGGRARYFSRFLPEQAEPIRQQVREVVQAVGPADVQQLHLRPALGFNANLGPLLTEQEMRLTDEPAGPHARLSVDDLALVHDRRTGLRLVDAASGQPVEVLYTGFLVPHALPSEEMLLAMVAGAPYFSFHELTLDLHARLQGQPSGRAAHAPRIQHRDLLLFRRRWGLRTEDLLADETTSSAAQFRGTGRARQAAGLPAQMFARPLFGRQISPMERAMSARPQLVDLTSRLHVQGLGKRLEPLGDHLLLEEYHPHPQAHGTPSSRGRHATEIFFEISLAPGGQR